MAFAAILRLAGQRGTKVRGSIRRARDTQDHSDTKAKSPQVEQIIHPAYCGQVASQSLA